MRNVPVPLNAVLQQQSTIGHRILSKKCGSLPAGGAQTPFSIRSVVFTRVEILLHWQWTAASCIFHRLRQTSAFRSTRSCQNARVSPGRCFALIPVSERRFLRRQSDSIVGRKRAAPFAL